MRILGFLSILLFTIIGCSGTQDLYNGGGQRCAEGYDPFPIVPVKGDIAVPVKSDDMPNGVYKFNEANVLFKDTTDKENVVYVHARLTANPDHTEPKEAVAVCQRNITKLYYPEMAAMGTTPGKVQDRSALVITGFKKDSSFHDFASRLLEYKFNNDKVSKDVILKVRKKGDSETAAVASQRLTSKPAIDSHFDGFDDFRIYCRVNCLAPEKDKYPKVYQLRGVKVPPDDKNVTLQVMTELVIEKAQ